MLILAPPLGCGDKKEQPTEDSREPAPEDSREPAPEDSHEPVPEDSHEPVPDDSREPETEDAQAPEFADCPEPTAEEPLAVMATWRKDPTTTVIIDWHVGPDDDALRSFCYKEVGAEGWQHSAQAEQHASPHSERSIHRVSLDGLRPGTEYRFRMGEFERRYKFTTMPGDIDDEPLVFAAGGDTMHWAVFLETMNKAVMEYNPDFVIWAGDLAMDDGEPERAHLWDYWFETNRNTLIDEDGRVVPILVAIGNHEVLDGYYANHDDAAQTDDWRESVAPYFYALFAFPGQPGYNVLDFGDYMTLIALDTEHTNPVEGAQTEWLAGVLEERADAGVPHVFPFYHVPAYPSYRNKSGRVSTLVRENWAPLFEEHGVKYAFEGHDHTYKRTHPILAGEVHPEGVVYVGDGAWGVWTRTADPERWYIARAEDSLHGVIVSLHGSERHFRVVSNLGEVLDEW